MLLYKNSCIDLKVVVAASYRSSKLVPQGAEDQEETMMTKGLSFLHSLMPFLYEVKIIDQVDASC